ncbi:hypothetical protein [Hydrogenimonas thermophila]|uniref:Uncharacterized protein n=1 Tax=Hydrogenimonas thermophila TaxID=223786 RepID=A0A1I5QBG7_9BACT|nr:hypothetical protein [Hydrogenimonas thermophila]WOE70847.1 hypothetical protein RZR91_04580 [Hydrogenimonas thermophila]WOE73365.1 hypothetical protein RZR97_04560 [Hydrogenimonas thermophila]SFP43186.1 hypothetical protein SAMN05216234_11914 [Hydrogenimonas thermophila]
MKKAIYLPTSQNIIIVQDGEEYCEIFIDGEYKTVSKSINKFAKLSYIKFYKNSKRGIL